jgi:RimJ/RimL family protein N-acetyltransferase
LILREIEEDDWPSVHRYASIPIVCRFMGWGPNTEQDSKDFVGRALAWRNEDPRMQVQLGIVCKDSGEFIGAGGIWRQGGRMYEAEMGYCLHPDSWNQGYMTEAARAFIEFGFREWDMHRIFARIDPENFGSIRVAEKCGMRREGHLLKTDWIKGEWRDMLIFAILEDEFNRLSF